MLRVPRGFSLLELFIVLAIAGILVSVSAPGLGVMLQKTQGEVAINEVTRMFSFARVTAIAENQSITLCGSSDTLVCDGHWELGLLAFADDNSDGVFDVSESLVKAVQLKAEGSSIQLRSFPRRQTVQFIGTGFTNKQNGSLTWCPASQDPHLAQQLIFIKTGRARIARDTDGDGVRENADGTPISC